MNPSHTTDQCWTLNEDKNAERKPLTNKDFHKEIHCLVKKGKTKSKVLEMFASVIAQEKALAKKKKKRHISDSSEYKEEDHHMEVEEERNFQKQVGNLGNSESDSDN